MRVVKRVVKKALPKLHNFTVIMLARQYYQTVMPEKKGYRIAIWVAFFILSGIVALQLLYPLDRAVPFASASGVSLSFATHDDMAKVLTEQFDGTKVKLYVKGGGSVEYTVKTAGAEPNTERMIAHLSEYPFWQRFIPLSVFWQVRHVKDADIYYTDAVLRQASQANKVKLSTTPTNARLALENGELVAHRERAGYEVTARQIYRQLSNTRLKLGKTTTIEIGAKRLAAQRTMAEFAGVRSQAKAALARKVSITVNGEVFTPDATDIASWLLLDTAPDGKVTLTMDEARAHAFIESVNKKVGSPPGRTNITMSDGRETARSPGAPGRTLDAATLVAHIKAYLLQGQGKVPVDAQLIDVAPTIVFNNRYSATREGLQAYLDDTGRSRNARIMIRQLDGNKWEVGTRTTESTPSGSTYKLYVALMLFDKMKKGETSWNDRILDTTVSTCFDRMTIASTNPCAEKWLAQWGLGYANDFVHGHGFSAGTTFTHPLAKHTTAADLTKYMTGLNDGSLVSEPYRGRLLHSLATHPYRYGIPTGSSGKVYDKVGFLWDYIHDTAIVHHPRGTYIMTIMTKGQSYAAIASMTREIERIMYP